MSSAKAEEKSEGSAGASSGGGGAGKIGLILTGVNLVATVGMIVILLISFNKQKNTPSVEDIQAGAEAGSHGAPEGGAQAEGGVGAAGKGSGGVFGRLRKDFGKMVTLDQFTVNLSTPGSATPKFVRVNVALEVPTDDAEEEINAKLPQVRNTIIDLFNSKRPSDLAAAEGREYLKEEIRNALNSFLVHGKVKGVFFTAFALSS